MEREKLEYTASNLYDGGWRAYDKEYIKEEYELDDEEADEISEMLDLYDNRK